MEKASITLTNGEILGVLPVLQQMVEKDLPVMSAYKLAHVVKALQDEFDIVNKLRTELVTKHQKLGDDGKPEISVDDKGNQSVALENAEQFHNDLRTLMEEKHELGLPFLKIEELGDIQTSAADLFPLIQIGILVE